MAVYGFQRSGLKTGVENNIFWSEIESGFGEPDSTPTPRIPRNTEADFYGDGEWVAEEFVAP